jgi:hypothetical protein
MKSIHVDFIPSRLWRAIWVITATAVAAMVMAYLPIYWKSYQEQRQIQNAIALLRQQAAPPPLPAPIKQQADPRLGSSHQAAEVLQRDINGVFTIIEAIKEPHVRLRNLSIDNTGNLVRLEYELDSVPRASSLTLALNAGYAQTPWKLESINLISTSKELQPGLPSVSLYRGQWSAALDKL